MANIVNFTDKQFENRLNDNLEELVQGKKAVESPTAFLLGGQPGSGKTSLREYSRAVTPQIRQAGNRLSGLAETAYASLLA